MVTKGTMVLKPRLKNSSQMSVEMVGCRRGRMGMVRWEEEKNMPEAMREVEMPRREGVRGRSGRVGGDDMVGDGVSGMRTR